MVRTVPRRHSAPLGQWMLQLLRIFWVLVSVIRRVAALAPRRFIRSRILFPLTGATDDLTVLDLMDGDSVALLGS